MLIIFPAKTNNRIEIRIQIQQYIKFESGRIRICTRIQATNTFPSFFQTQWIIIAEF